MRDPQQKSAGAGHRAASLHRDCVLVPNSYIHQQIVFAEWCHLVIMILGLSLLLLLETVSSCFRVLPMLVLVGVKLALFEEIPGDRSHMQCQQTKYKFYIPYIPFTLADLVEMSLIKGNLFITAKSVVRNNSTMFIFLTIQTTYEINIL